jgi:hypothetical protein
MFPFWELAKEIIRLLMSAPLLSNCCDPPPVVPESPSPIRLREGILTLRGSLGTDSANLSGMLQEQPPLFANFPLTGTIPKPLI